MNSGAHTTTTTPGPIVVGVDGSANAVSAMRVASTLALGTGAEVVAVHAVGLLTTIGDRKLPSSEHRDEIAEHLRTDWCSVLSEALGDRWRPRMLDGNPAEVLLHVADQEQASFIVVGARGVGGHPDLMLGSTSHQVIHHASCPAVVVPPVDRGPASAEESNARNSI
jgi:nucleotide-binding universal stress UspA family protein